MKTLAKSTLDIPKDLVSSNKVRNTRLSHKLTKKMHKEVYIRLGES